MTFKESNMLFDRSFGIIPIFKADNTYQFLLIQHLAGHWGFPKGHKHGDESAWQAACREFEEETNITNYQLLEGVFFYETYRKRLDPRVEKMVIYFPALVYSTAFEYQESEIKDGKWGNYEDTMKRITFPHSRQILIDVNQYLIGFKEA